MYQNYETIKIALEEVYTIDISMNSRDITVSGIVRTPLFYPDSFPAE